MLVQNPTMQLRARPSVGSSLGGSGFGKAETPELVEVWIVLEPCNGGSLQVCCPHCNISAILLWWKAVALWRGPL